MLRLQKLYPVIAKALVHVCDLQNLTPPFNKEEKSATCWIHGMSVVLYALCPLLG